MYGHSDLLVNFVYPSLLLMLLYLFLFYMKLGDYRSQRAYYEVYGPQSDSSLPQLIAFKQFLESKSVNVRLSSVCVCVCSVVDIKCKEFIAG
jgi:hypothetical protein